VYRAAFLKYPLFVLSSYNHKLESMFTKQIIVRSARAMSTAAAARTPVLRRAMLYGEL
jgi:hypothetical protein